MNMNQSSSGTNPTPKAAAPVADARRVRIVDLLRGVAGTRKDTDPKPGGCQREYTQDEIGLCYGGKPRSSTGLGV